MQDEYYIKYYRQENDKRTIIGSKEINYLYLEMEGFFTDRPY